MPASPQKGFSLKRPGHKAVLRLNDPPCTLAPARTPSTRKQLVISAEKAAKQGKWAAAVDLYSNALKPGGESLPGLDAALTRRKRGACHIHLMRHDLAWADFDAAYKAYPCDPEALLWRAFAAGLYPAASYKRLQSVRGKVAKAWDAMPLQKQAPHEVLFRAAMGMVHYGCGDHRLALKCVFDGPFEAEWSHKAALHVARATIATQMWGGDPYADRVTQALAQHFTDLPSPLVDALTHRANDFIALPARAISSTYSLQADFAAESGLQNLESAGDLYNSSLRACFKEGDVPAALEYLRAIAEHSAAIAKTSLLAREMYISLSMASGRADVSARRLENWLRVRPNDPKVLFLAARQKALEVRELLREATARASSQWESQEKCLVLVAEGKAHVVKLLGLGLRGAKLQDAKNLSAFYRCMGAVLMSVANSHSGAVQLNFTAAYGPRQPQPWDALAAARALIVVTYRKHGLERAAVFLDDLRRFGADNLDAQVLICQFAGLKGDFAQVVCAGERFAELYRELGAFGSNQQQRLRAQQMQRVNFMLMHAYERTQRFDAALAVAEQLQCVVSGTTEWLPLNRARGLTAGHAVEVGGISVAAANIAWALTRLRCYTLLKSVRTAIIKAFWLPQGPLWLNICSKERGIFVLINAIGSWVVGPVMMGACCGVALAVAEVAYRWRPDDDLQCYEPIDYPVVNQATMPLPLNT